MYSAAAIVAAVAVLAIGVNVATPEKGPFDAGADPPLRVGGGGDFATIGEAVAAARDGDTILVAPGTYDESVTVTKDITIRGDGDRATGSDQPDGCRDLERSAGAAVELDR